MTSEQDVGASEGAVAAAELRLLELPHSVWRSVGKTVVRSSLRKDGEIVCECSDDQVADFIANAPRDVEMLSKEVALLRLQIEKIRAGKDDAGREFAFAARRTRKTNGATSGYP